MSDARARGEQLKRNRRKAPLLDEPTLKSLRSHTLSTLRREATERRKRELAEAQSVLQQAARLEENRTNAVSLGGVTMRMAAEFTAPVVASLAVDAPIHVSLLRCEKAHAFTDFESIHVSLPESDFDRATDPDDLARLLSIAKGLIYHEAGHIVFTLPFEEMVEGAIQQGAVRPAEFRGRKGHAMLADDEQIELYRWVHNVLEDQRMECALVRLSPVLENHLRVTALYMLVDPAAKQGRTSAYWPLLSGRTYLSKDLLTRMRRLAYAEATAAGLAREFRVMEGAVRKYKRATTERELFEAVCQGVRAMRYWFTPHERRVMPKIDDHHDRERLEKVYERRRLADSATHDDFEPFEADENQPAAKTSTNDTKSTGPQAARLDDGPIDSRQTIKELVEESLATEMERAIDRSEVTRVLREFGGTASTRIPHDPTIREMTPDESVRAHKVRAGMLDVLAPLYAQADPYWQFRCEQGVLDPLTYQLREPGDTDYWAEQHGDTSTARSLALSLVLDVSYSMSQQASDLSVAAVGIRLACDELEIPCTITTFANSVNTFLDADEETREIAVEAHGGTYPREALEDLRFQHHGKKQHLVIVFTDGEWDSTPTMDQYRHDGMTAIGIALGKGCRPSVATRRFDQVVVINRVESLAAEVTRALSTPLVSA